MPNDIRVAENSSRALNRDRLIAEILVRAHCWRNMEAKHTTERETEMADRCRVRAEVLEQLAHDLDDRTLTLGEAVPR